MLFEGAGTLVALTSRGPVLGVQYWASCACLWASLAHGALARSCSIRNDAVRTLKDGILGVVRDTTYRYRGSSVAQWWAEV